MENGYLKNSLDFETHFMFKTPSYEEKNLIPYPAESGLQSNSLPLICLDQINWNYNNKEESDGF